MQASMIKPLKTKAQDNPVELSPLIDMVFILLIFFMVTTTFNNDLQVDIARPKAASASVSNEKSIKIYISKDSSIYLNDQLVRIWVLQSKIRDLLKSHGSKSILVVTDKSVSADRLIEVVDQCRLGGAADIGVATDVEVAT